ncbi:hypothetical protein R3X25_14215 [Lutibacter sp. TH_r2]|uniref:hypothetical protein n=1 Tax=Lutibacter sp. TH_r2 TaxID=3082083 RepID=UPI00295300E1|nr:hypothetical protein [Lutibacter sp. TH_r2]MDV7188443.1 hypothetical protein [Lutibacter sp. TH_r2]
MNIDPIQTNVFLEELINVYYHKFIIYIPEEVIDKNVLNEIKEDIKDTFLNDFYFLDNNLGSSKVNNEDAAEVNIYLGEKRTFLQQNTFKLLEKSKDLNTVEFLIIIEKYYEQLSLFIYITEWFCKNIKKYKGETVSLSLIGAFNIQYQMFIAHLKDVCNYFGSFIDFDKDFDFSKETLVLQHIPELVSRYVKIAETQKKSKVQEKPKNTLEKKELDQSKKTDKKITNPKKRKRPQLDDKKIEAMILSKVFNVEV